MRRLRYIPLIILVGIGGFWFYSRASWFHYRDTFIRELTSTSKEHQRAVFEKYLGKLSSTQTLDLLEQEYPLCHGEAHDLGKVIFAKSHDVTASIQECRNSCSGGCFHGVLMEAFHSVQPKDEHIELADLSGKINDLCSDEKLVGQQPIGNCAHGIGHAVMYLTDYHIENGLEYCKSFLDRRLQFYCNGGAFMEYLIENGEEDAKTKPLLYPCDTYKEFPAACYTYKAKYLLGALDEKKFVSKCLELDGFEEIGCFQGIGFVHTVEVAARPHILASLCANGSLNDQKSCIEGAVGPISESAEETAYKACESLNDELHDFCKHTMSLKKHSLERDFSIHFELNFKVEP